MTYKINYEAIEMAQNEGVNWSIEKEFELRNYLRETDCLSLFDDSDAVADEYDY